MDNALCRTTLEKVSIRGRTPERVQVDPERDQMANTNATVRLTSDIYLKNQSETMRVRCNPFRG